MLDIGPAAVLPLGSITRVVWLVKGRQGEVGGVGTSEVLVRGEMVSRIQSLSLVIRA